MQALWDAVRPVLFESLLSLLVVVVGAAATAAINALRRKLHGEAALAALARVEKLAGIVVRELEQTVVPDLKAALSDGKLTRAEIDHLRDLARTRMSVYLGKDAPTAALIDSMVEAAVQQLREREQLMMLPPPARVPADAIKS